MSDVMQKLGLKQKAKGSFEQALFYFMREFHLNPLDEEYVVRIQWKRWFWKIKRPYIKFTKKGISIPLFNALMEEVNNHYKREEAEMKKKRR